MTVTDLTNVLSARTSIYLIVRDWRPCDIRRHPAGMTSRLEHPGRRNRRLFILYVRPRAGGKIYSFPRLIDETRFDAVHFVHISSFIC